MAFARPLRHPCCPYLETIALVLLFLPVHASSGGSSILFQWDPPENTSTIRSFLLDVSYDDEDAAADAGAGEEGGGATGASSSSSSSSSSAGATPTAAYRQAAVKLRISRDTVVRELVSCSLRARGLYHSTDQVETVSATVCDNAPGGRSSLPWCVGNDPQQQIRLAETGPTWSAIGARALGAWYERGAGSYNFSNTWHVRHAPYWRTALAGLVGKPGAAVLEVGTFEGLASSFLLHEILTHETARLVCVDTFQGSSEHEPAQVTNLFERHRANIGATGFSDKVTVRVGKSQQVLRDLSVDEPFDAIYIDASHHAADVLQDAAISWGLLKDQGLMIFDDVLWVETDPDGQRRQWGSLNHPKPAVDAFVAVMANELEVIHRDYQVIIRKTERECIT